MTWLRERSKRPKPKRFFPSSSWDTDGASTGPPEPYWRLSCSIVLPPALGKSSGLATGGAVSAPASFLSAPLPQPPVSNAAAASAAAIQILWFLTRP